MGNMPPSLAKLNAEAESADPATRMLHQRIPPVIRRSPLPGALRHEEDDASNAAAESTMMEGQPEVHASRLPEIEKARVIQNIRLAALRPGHQGPMADHRTGFGLPGLRPPQVVQPVHVTTGRWPGACRSHPDQPHPAREHRHAERPVLMGWMPEVPRALIVA